MVSNGQGYSLAETHSTNGLDPQLYWDPQYKFLYPLATHSTNRRAPQYNVPGFLFLASIQTKKIGTSRVLKTKETA